MKKTRYDLVFGVGSACSASETLREAGLQFLSFPFDWVVCNATDDLKVRTEMLRTGFAHWFDREDLAFAGCYDLSWQARDIYRNVRTGVVFNHDFNRGEVFAVAYDGVATKYRRRIERLFSLLRVSKRVLAFRLDHPGQKTPTSSEGCLRLKRMLEEKFPGVTVDVLVMTHDPAVPPDRPREERLADGVVRLSLDCRCNDPRAAAYVVDVAVTAAALKARVAVRDYRTRAEKAAFRRGKKRAHWAKYGATSFLGYRWERLRRGLLKDVLPSVLRARLRRVTCDRIVPLGTNCEVAFRFYVSWGFVDSSLFAWAQTFDLKGMCGVLRRLDRLFVGAATFDEVSKMWKCEETGAYFHGNLKWSPGHAVYSAEELSADLAALRGRVAHLRTKFLDCLRNDGRTLLVHRLSDGDATSPDLDARLCGLESVLTELGARDCTLLVVTERRTLSRMPAGPNRVFRAVEKFNPCDRVTDADAGDPIGWRTIWTEFAPAKILPKRHAFKFE